MIHENEALLLLCSWRLLAASGSKILSMVRLTCGMVVVPKFCVSVYDKPPCGEEYYPQGVA